MYICTQAARTALSSVASPGPAAALAASHAAALPRLSKQLCGLLVEGLVREEYVLQVLFSLMLLKRSGAAACQSFQIYA